MTKIKELLAQLCPNGVEWKELGEVCEVVRGVRVTKNQLLESGYPVVSGGSGYMGYIDTYNREAGTITIAQYGTAGYVNIQKEKFWANDVCFSVYPKKIILNKYLYYLLANKQEYLYSISNRSAVPYSISKNKILKIKIPIPPLKIQQEIVQILDKFTDYITELTAELTDRKKQYSFYRDKLLSFSDEVYQVEWKTLGEVLNKGRGTKITAGQMKELHKEGAPIRIFAGGKTFADVDYGDIPDKDVHEEVGIVVKSRGIIEFEYCTRPFSFKNEFWSYSSDSELVDLKYVYYFLNQNKEHFQTIANNMQMPQISSRDTENFKIPIPSLAIQERIVHVLDDFDTVCNDLNIGLPKEIELRKKQYEYFRDQLLTFAAEGVYTGQDKTRPD